MLLFTHKIKTYTTYVELKLGMTIARRGVRAPFHAVLFFSPINSMRYLNIYIVILILILIYL